MPFYFASVGLTDLHEFGIAGIDLAAMLDPSDPLAFPTGLEFEPGPIVGDLEMTALTSGTVPAPNPRRSRSSPLACSGLLPLECVDAIGRGDGRGA